MFMYRQFHEFYAVVSLLKINRMTILLCCFFEGLWAFRWFKLPFTLMIGHCSLVVFGMFVVIIAHKGKQAYPMTYFGQF